MFRSDGRHLAGAFREEFSGSGGAIEWDITAGSEVHSAEFNEDVTAVWFDSDGKLLAETYEEDPRGRRYRVRDVAQGVIRVDLDLAGYRAGGVPLSSPRRDLLALGNRCFNSPVQVLDPVSGAVRTTVNSSAASTPVVAFSPDESHVAVAARVPNGASGSVSLVALENGLVRWSAPTSTPVGFLTFSPHGDLLCCSFLSDPGSG